MQLQVGRRRADVGGIQRKTQLNLWGKIGVLGGIYGPTTLKPICFHKGVKTTVGSPRAWSHPGGQNVAFVL